MDEVGIVLAKKVGAGSHCARRVGHKCFDGGWCDAQELKLLKHRCTQGLSVDALRFKNADTVGLLLRLEDTEYQTEVGCGAIAGFIDGKKQVRLVCEVLRLLCNDLCKQIIIREIQTSVKHPKVTLLD